MGWNRSEKVCGFIKGHPILFILRIRFIISGTKRKVFVLYNFASMNKKFYPLVEQLTLMKP